MMIDKNAVRDLGLVALVQHNGYVCDRNTDGSYKLRVPDPQFSALHEKYRLHYRPILTRIERLRPMPNLQNQHRNVAGVP